MWTKAGLGGRGGGGRRFNDAVVTSANHKFLPEGRSYTVIGSVNPLPYERRVGNRVVRGTTLATFLPVLTL